MKKEVRVLIVEDDPFARNWIALLLARDWRTRVVGEAGSLAEMTAALRSGQSLLSDKPDLVLLNADLLAGEEEWATLTAPAAQLAKPAPAAQVVLMGKRASSGLVDHLPTPGFSGYLLKDEIRYAVSWAIALAGPQAWVITPGVENLIHRIHRPRQLLVLDGRKSVHNLTEHELEVARLALIFSMERRELSDEIKISQDWSYGLVSSIYRKLGMEELLSGEVDPAEYLGKAFAENPRFQEVLRQPVKSKKKNDLETLAFHILTMPEIREG